MTIRIDPRNATWLVLSGALLWAAPGCDQQDEADQDDEVAEQGDTPGEDETGDENGDDGDDGPAPEPPTAADLEEYTADLEGDGPLMATFETSMGTIECRLLEDEAPMTVANFVGLARGMKPWQDPESGEIREDPLYDGTIFHRVIPEFMIQGGDPLGEGRGGPGYQFDNEVSEDLGHDEPGTLSMANAGPDTNGSQFFITETAQPRLDGDYSIFGRCDNVDVVEEIARVEKEAPNSSKPAEDVVLESVTISRGES